MDSPDFDGGQLRVHLDNEGVIGTLNANRQETEDLPASSSSTTADGDEVPA